MLLNACHRWDMCKAQANSQANLDITNGATLAMPQNPLGRVPVPIQPYQTEASRSRHLSGLTPTKSAADHVHMYLGQLNTCLVPPSPILLPLLAARTYSIQSIRPTVAALQGPMTTIKSCASCLLRKYFQGSLSIFPSVPSVQLSAIICH